jgi:L-seryl-tRNA(Ser) seleniumtransferase
VEIGGGFRIPEVIAQSGATLVEVGTTNRTRLSDYARAIATAEVEIGAVLRVHPSNFRTVGFVEEVGIEELCRLGPPVIDDVGSGLLSSEVGLLAAGDEPPMARSVAAGASLVCASGDKLLGGPQAGLLVGAEAAIAAARTHPLARAVRIDKLSLAALAETLRLYRDPERARREIPALAMLELSEDTLAARAQRLREAIGAGAFVIRATAKVGGGTLPLLELAGPAVKLDGHPGTIMPALRAGEPPVIARVHDGHVVLDPRTLADDELDDAAVVARAALARR